VRLAVGVVKVPPNSPVMQECYAVAKEATHARSAGDEIGPELVTRSFARHGLVSGACTPTPSTRWIGGTPASW
jgi:hypothetical protein